MLIHYRDIAQQSQAKEKIKMKERHAPLCAQYVADPISAVIVDRAKTSSEMIAATNPLNTEIVLGQHNPIGLPVGLHRAVGGDGDCPNPGDMLCGAIASCFDMTLRVVANRVGIKLKKLEIEVSGTVDVRGTLRVDPATPVSFQRFDIEVCIKPSGFVPRIMLNKIVKAAERSCVVVQTVRAGAEINVSVV